MSENKVNKQIEELVEKISELSVLDLSALVKILEEKFGVSGAMMMSSGASSAAVAEAPKAAVDEKTSFNIELAEVGANTIGVIKAVRDITQKGLKDSKDLVDGAPTIIKENVGKEEAETIKKKFEEVGAKVNLK